MSAIFISHSSKDNEFCEKLMAWLDNLGHRSVFLDIDGSSGIAAGYNWEQKLYQELRICRAVIVICTENLMGSKWCFAEITQARSLGKHIFPLKIADCKIDSILSDSQVVDFLKFDEKEAFERLKNGLAIAGIDAEDPYDWDGSRSPYPGLLSFQEADAAIFFGRDKEIGDGLDVLNGIYRYDGSGLVMTLGASGSGKSSLVRAGIVPRLKRDPARWLVIDPFQPGDDPFLELAKILSKAYIKYSKIKRKADAIRQSLIFNEVAIEQPITTDDENVSVDETSIDLDELQDAIKTLEGLFQKSAIETNNSKHRLLRSSLKDLQQFRNEFASPNYADVADNDDGSRPAFIEELLNGSGRENASLLIIIDQFEELLNRPPDHLGSRFLVFLRRLLDNKDNKLVIIGTMRSDFLGAFQQNSALRSLEYGKILVGPVDTASLTEIIEKPAELAGVRIEPKLLQALIEDAGTDDALPLLAFTLRELYDKFADDNLLEHREYKDFLGGIQGAVAKAAEGVLEKQQLTLNQEENLRKAFLFMSRINENGQFTREVAKWIDMPQEVHGVLERLVAGRLLVSRGGENGDGTIEVAHETLFRSWKRLKTWLDEDREFLLWRSRLSRAKQEWDYNERDKNTLLKGAVLHEASNWFERYSNQLDSEEQHYVLESLKEDLRRRRKRRASIIGVISFLTLIGLSMTFLFINATEQTNIAQQKTIEAKVSDSTAQRQTAIAEIRSIEAEREKKEAIYQKSQAEEQTNIAEEQRNRAFIESKNAIAQKNRALANYLIGEANREVQIDPTLALRLAGEAFDKRSDDTTIVKDVYAIYSENSFYKRILKHQGAVKSAVFSTDGRSILTRSSDNTARLWDSQGNPQGNPMQHEETVSSAVFSPDGKTILTSSRDGTARLWDQQGNPLGKPMVHEGGVFSAVFSPDGKTILSSGEDRAARLWDLQGNPLQKAMKHKFAVYSAVFSPDGKTIVTSSADSTARLWDLQGDSIGNTMQHEDGVYSAAFSPDGKSIVTSSADNTARLWDSQGNPLGSPMQHEDGVYSAVFSSEGKSIVTSSADNTARLWDSQGNPLGSPMQHEGAVTSAVFSTDGKTILTSSADNTARLWDAQGNPLYKPMQHEGAVTSAVFSTDGKTILTSSEDGTARLWDPQIESIGNPMQHEGAVYSANFSPDGSTVLTNSEDGTARLWDSQGNSLGSPMQHEGVVYSANFSPDGSTVLTNSEDGTTRLWDSEGNPLGNPMQHEGAVYSANFSPDEKTIVTSSADNTARLWNSQGNSLYKPMQHKDVVYSAIFSPDGKTILTSSEDGTARLWDPQGNPLGKTMQHEDAVYSAVFSPEGKTVLTSSKDGTARFWDLQGNPLGKYMKHEGMVFNAVFSPDGKTVLTRSANTARLWDLQGNPLYKPMRHEGQVLSAVFSPDGKTILTSSWDGTARLWNPQGKLLGKPMQHEDQVLSAVFSPDGKTILTSSQDGTARLWKMVTLEAFLKSDHIAPFTRAQREKYGID